MTILLLVLALACAAFGAYTGNPLGLLISAGTMALAITRVGRVGSRDEIQAMRGMLLRVLSRHRQLLLGAALAAAVGATLTTYFYGDPSTPAMVLWVLGLASLICAGYLHDRHANLGRRIWAAMGLNRWDILAITAVTLGAFFLRIHRLDAFLPAVHGDEAEMGMLGRLALFGPSGGRGEAALPYFGTAFLDHPTLFHFLQAEALALFGDDITGLRLLSVLFGALCVPLIYLIARISWGRTAAIGAAWLLAVSHIHIQYSRIALNNIQTVWFAALFALLVIVINALGEYPRGDETQPPQSGKRMTLYILLGLTVGLSQYFYYGSRLIAVLMVPVLFLLWRTGRAKLCDLGALTVSVIVSYLPLLCFYVRNVPAFVNRSRGVTVFSKEGIKHALGSSALWPDDWLKLLLHQLRENVLLFVNYGDRSAFYVAEIPSFDPLTVALFWLGLGVLVTRWRHFAAQSVLLWLVLGVLLGGVATNDSPNLPRLIVALPPVFVIAGAALQQLSGILTPCPRRGWCVAGTAGIVIAAVTLSLNYSAYFERYAARQPYTVMVTLAQLMSRHAGTHRSVLMGAPNLSVHYGTIRFIADGADRAEIFSPEEFPAQMEASAAKKQGILLIATPNNIGMLEDIRQSYPGGEYEAFYHSDQLVGFASYLIDPL